jgi:ammonia channel protein AmtB
MALRERLGCFLLAAGSAVALIYAIPLWSKFQQNPQTVPLDWLAIFGAGVGVVWVGWQFYRAGSHATPSRRRPSLAARAWNHWQREREDDNSQEGT